MTEQSFRKSLLCATMLMGAASAPAFAADAAPDPASAAPGAANEIVVTATRRSTTIQDAPINISAVSAEQLSKQRIDDVKSLSAFTPGMTVVDTGPGSTGNIILRGISSSSTSAGGSNYQNSLGVYLGEVPMYLDFKLIDISRVEVLQGPQGTLYGLGTLSGAVRYMPNRPTADHFSFDFHERAFGQSHSSSPGINIDGAVNIPIIKDHVALRSVVGYYDNPGFIDYNHLLKNPGVSNPQPVRGTSAAQGSFGTQADYNANFYSKRDVNYEHTFTTRNQLLVEINPDIKSYFTYAHQETRTGGRQANGAGVLGTGNYEAPWRYLEPSARISDLFSAEFNVNLGIAQLVATTAFTNQKNQTKGDNTDLLLDLDYGYEAFPAFSSYNTQTEYYRQFNQEVRLVSSHGGPFSWVVGGFYNNLRDYRNYREYTPGYANYIGVNRPDDLEYMSFVNTATKEKAVYGEGTFHITKAWQVTGGLRYFNYDAMATGGTDTPLTGGGLARTPYPLVQFAASRIKSGATSASGTVWKANTSYKFSNQLLAYATFSTGYRTGNVNRVAPCVLPLGPGQNVCALPNELSYKPDKTRNAEIGIRASLFDKRLQFTVDAFHVNWNNIQVATQTVNGATGVTVNAKDAVSQGFEFSGQFKITPRLQLAGTYSYTDAHLTQDASGVVVSGGVAYDVKAGDRLPGSAKNSGSAQLTYTFPLSQGRDIEANWATTYTGDIYSRIGLRGNGQDIPGYVLHRASVTYHAKTFDIGVYADNIFNKYAVTAISNDVSSYNQTRTGVVERYYAQGVLTPRRVGVDFHFHYY
ncbi:TonB-dependent receptor [Novosphingobium rosa]|uniref:TonB-dependent receptor n=1 Tax=Novosphingobium rosa TaxID=76978 RepID=UPI0027D7D4B0|nr:TonB-dependent receptor [Novosphingobium rosa]